MELVEYATDMDPEYIGAVFGSRDNATILFGEINVRREGKRFRIVVGSGYKFNAKNVIGITFLAPYETGFEKLAAAELSERTGSSVNILGRIRS